MSDPKTTILVLGAGCAAMIGIAAAVVSTGSFFSDLPSVSAQASQFQLPPHKVKTVAIVEKPAERGPAITPQPDRSPTASVKVAVGERDALHGANPRWARDSGSDAPEQPQQEALLAAYADDQPAIEGEGSSTDMDNARDPFAMIVAPDENAPTVELAGTVPHVPAPAPRRSDSDGDRPAPKAASTGKALSASATLNSGANMRSAPRSGSGVLMVVPDGARVSIAPGCEQWCEISYNGRRGFVYKDFIGGGRQVKARAKAETASTQPLDKAIYGDANFISSGKQSGGSSGQDNATETTASNTTPTKQIKMLAQPTTR